MSVEFHRDDDIGFVTMDNPPVNAIGLETRRGLWDALDWVDGQEGMTRVILSGKGRAFAAGADAKEFDAPPVEPHLPDIINRIETCSIPWVAAIGGVALGGGCELIMGCRYRIASPGALVGLPEVTLGVVPGAGGTQRLPRLVGMETALTMISTGKPVNAQRALEIGLIHAVSPDPARAAIIAEQAAIDAALATRDCTAPAPDGGAIEAARQQARKKTTNQVAPERAIDLVSLAADTPFKDALSKERQQFIELREGPQAHALRHMFFAQRAARLPAKIKAEAGPIEKIAVVGGGTMGAGIAYAHLNAGQTVTIIEVDQAGVDRAVQNVEKIIAASERRGLIGPDQAADIRKRFKASDNYGAAKDADIAIEAAFESMDVKKKVFAALETHIPSASILATNTSYLDINEIASIVADPSRVIGLHFFAPAHIMKLLEIVKGDQTSGRAIATGFGLAKRLGKVPVLAGVCDGFIGNRILARYREAADQIMLQGAAPWEIDAAMVAFGYAMGPYEAQDMSGLDIAYANRRRQDATRDPNRQYVGVADRLVELGKLGRKTGAGWYEYPDGSQKAHSSTVVEYAAQEARAKGIEQHNFEPSEISTRLLLAMINEAAQILKEGIATTARDIDLVTVFGYGFPRWRGGLMHYADQLGVASILPDLEELAQTDPIAWTPSDVLVECAQTGSLIADYAPE